MNTARLKFLMSEGADVNTMDTHGETPLLKACRLENGTFVKILLDSGADVTPGTTNGRRLSGKLITTSVLLL